MLCNQVSACGALALSLNGVESISLLSKTGFGYCRENLFDDVIGRLFLND